MHVQLYAKLRHSSLYKTELRRYIGSHDIVQMPWQLNNYL